MAIYQKRLFDQCLAAQERAKFAYAGARRLASQSIFPALVAQDYAARCYAESWSRLAHLIESSEEA